MLSVQSTAWKNLTAMFWSETTVTHFFWGAVDASSGSATLMEISRVLGKLKDGGWRPRRTVKLCSWGAEELGLVGSLEWVQENAKLLSNRAVVYLNTDVAVGGNYVVAAQTCPMLDEAVSRRAKKVKDPSGKTVYDTMVSRMPKYLGEPPTLPYLFFSDYLPFYMSIGVPSADFSYFHVHDNHFMLYPAYHTQEDSFYWIKSFVDPKFEYHATMTTFVGGMLLDFSDAPILPLDVVRYARALHSLGEQLGKMLEATTKNISTKFALDALKEFVNTSNLFQDAKGKLSGNESALVLRTINDQLVQVEKAFITPYLKAGDPMYKHVFSRNSLSQAFPGVVLALKNAIRTGDFAEVNQQLSLVEEAFLSAADIIKPVV